jgi:hypothetical protein
MYKIGFGCVAKERANDPDDIMIKPGISFFERLAVTDAVEH